MPPDAADVLTVPEVACRLGVGKNLAYELARRRVFPVLVLGRRLVVPRVAFERWLLSAGTAAASAANNRRAVNAPERP